MTLLENLFDHLLDQGLAIIHLEEMCLNWKYYNPTSNYLSNLTVLLTKYCLVEEGTEESSIINLKNSKIILKEKPNMLCMCFADLSTEKRYY